MTTPSLIREHYTGTSIRLLAIGLAIDLRVNHNISSDDLGPAKELMRDMVRDAGLTGTDVAVECEELFQFLDRWFAVLDQRISSPTQ